MKANTRGKPQQVPINAGREPTLQPFYNRNLDIALLKLLYVSIFTGHTLVTYCILPRLYDAPREKWWNASVSKKYQPFNKSNNTACNVAKPDFLSDCLHARLSTFYHFLIEKLLYTFTIPHFYNQGLLLAASYIVFYLFTGTFNENMKKACWFAPAIIFSKERDAATQRPFLLQQWPWLA